MIKKIILLILFTPITQSLLAPPAQSPRRRAQQERVAASVRLVESMLQRSPKTKVYCLKDFYSTWNETCEILNERPIDEDQESEVETFVETLKAKIKANRNFDPLSIDQSGLSELTTKVVSLILITITIIMIERGKLFEIDLF